MRFFFFLSAAKYNNRFNWTLSVREAAPWRSWFLHKFGHDMTYCPAFVPEAPIRTFRNVSVSNWGQCKNSKEFGESNVDYEGTAARETHSVRFDEKITPEFVGIMIDNDPSTGVSKFLIRQTVDEDNRSLSYKMRKGHTSRRTLAWLPGHLIPQTATPFIIMYGAK